MHFAFCEKQELILNIVVHNLQSRGEQEVRKMGRSTINSACARQGKTGSRLEVEYVEDGAELIQDKMNPSLNLTRIGRSIRM